MFEHEICINLTCFRFQRTKYFCGQNFWQQVRFSAVFSAEILSDKVYALSNLFFYTKYLKLLQHHHRTTSGGIRKLSESELEHH